MMELAPTTHSPTRMLVSHGAKWLLFTRNLLKAVVLPKKESRSQYTESLVINKNKLCGRRHDSSKG